MKKNKPLKILQVTPYYFPSIGGVSGVAQYISEELVNRGHEVTVFTANRDHADRPKVKYPDREIINGVVVKRFKSLLNIGHMSLCPMQIPELLKGNFDIVHNHCYRHIQGDIICSVTKKKNIPIVLHGHGPFFSKKSISKAKAFFYALYDWQAKKGILRNVDGIIALSQFEYNHYIQLSVTKDKIKIIPNAASPDCFEPIDPQPFIIKHSLEDKIILLYLSTLNSFKRPDLLIKAMPQIIKKIPNAFILYAGPDAGMVDLMRHLAIDLGIENYYKWVGPLQGIEKQQAYEAAGIFFLPSEEEPFGMVLVEAMAHGKPVIACDAIGPSEIIQDGNTGFIVPRGNFDRIAGAALQLLTNQSLLLNMGNEAKATALAQYSVSSIVDKIEETYYELLEKQTLTV